MTKIKLILITLFALTLVACGSSDPNEPFLGKWVVDVKTSKMNLKAERGSPADTNLREKIQETHSLIYEFTDTSLKITSNDNPSVQRYEFGRKEDPLRLVVTIEDGINPVPNFLVFKLDNDHIIFSEAFGPTDKNALERPYVRLYLKRVKF